MGYGISSEEEIRKILISIIRLYGDNGVPLEKVNDEFQTSCGFSIPYKKFGSCSLRSWLLTLPEIYLVRDCNDYEVLITQSPKSMHMKELISNQKASHQKVPKTKRKHNYDNGYNRPYKVQKRFELHNLPEGSFLHTSFLHRSSIHNDSDRCEKFEQLESMLPLLYKHQALGDDFFLDIADTKLGYYVPKNGPKQCGLCSTEQTILELTEKVKHAANLAPRVVVMIGFQDLLEGTSVSNMISDLRQLIIELKRKHTAVTLVTLIPSPKMPNIKRFQIRMDIYNNAIIDYASDPLLKCNIIDMHTIFEREAAVFRRDFDRFKKVAKNDPYKVFSDYGRKIFLSALKSCLKEQIEFGY